MHRLRLKKYIVFFGCTVAEVKNIYYPVLHAETHDSRNISFEEFCLEVYFWMKNPPQTIEIIEVNFAYSFKTISNKRLELNRGKQTSDQPIVSDIVSTNFAFLYIFCC